MVPGDHTVEITDLGEVRSLNVEVRWDGAGNGEGEEELYDVLNLKEWEREAGKVNCRLVISPGSTSLPQVWALPFSVLPWQEKPWHFLVNCKWYL